MVSVESRVRRIEKNPSPKRLKANVVTTEKLGFRAVTTKTVAPDAITPNEAAFGTPVVSETEPTEYLKAGSNWFNPSTGEQKVYDATSNNFVDVTAVDATARASADGKNTIYRGAAEPTGGTYVTGDTWFDTDDNNKIYRYDSAYVPVAPATSKWVALQLGGNALANISANSITAGTIDASVITVSNLDAGNITTGSLSATRIGAGTISASISITAPTITSGGLTINADGSITTSTGNFGLSTAGVLTATGVDITGEINATGGAFTGYVTAGNMRIGSNVNSTYEGIYVGANNYWYDDGTFKVGDGTESMSYTALGGLVVTGEINATGGNFTGYVTAGNMRIGSNVDLTSEGIYVNANNYWYDTGAFKVGDGTESMTYTAAGGLVVTGEISAGTFSGNISSTATIVGGSFWTSNYASGTGLAIASVAGGDVILFNVAGASRGSIAAVAGGVVLTSGASQLTLSYAGSVQLTSTDNALLMSAAPYFTGGSGSNTGGGLGSLRNTWASSSDPGAVGSAGDVWLKWA